MENIIFLFSLPRSGSTLLQRILMSHPDIASVAEPWLLLPFCYSFKQTGILAEYNQITAFNAFKDFIKNLPNKEKDYYSAIRNLVMSLYNKLCLNGETYFLDKTPRYYFIISEIAQIFPDAKFIFLFRSPVHIMASIIETWCDGNLKKLYLYKKDLDLGPVALSNGYRLLKDKSYAIQYERFVENPEKYLKEICNYLEIGYNERMLKDFVTQDTKGRMGDPTGVKKYKSISKESLFKWNKIFNTSFRKKLIYNYIRSLDDGVLEIQGYNKDKILQEISELNTKISLRDLKDIYHYNYSVLVRCTKANIFFDKKIKNWAGCEFLS